MALTPSNMVPLGTKAPFFSLQEPLTGRTVTLADFDAAPALLVAFLCNHCPYVIHLRPAFVALAKELQGMGVAVVGINANDAARYPEDRPERMVEDAKAYGFSFPYLYDETQEVARAYDAACTPDFYLFDQQRTLVYRGQMDGSRPGNNVPNDGRDLRLAVEALLKGDPVPAEQRPSAGCSIKWKVQ